MSTTRYMIHLGSLEARVTLTADAGGINLSGVFSDSADCLDLPVDGVSRVGSMVCAFLGKLVVDGRGRDVLGELAAAYHRRQDQIDAFEGDHDPDEPSIAMTDNAD